MKNKEEIKPNYGPVYAAAMYPDLAKIFQNHGYALSVHGSLARDMDLVAIPWTEKVSDHDKVLDEITSKFSATVIGKSMRKNHNRVAYTISIGFGHCSIDLSFFSQGPIDMLLFCPNCSKQHIDEPNGEWTNPPHRSHQCLFCGHIWRPSDVSTNGVAEIKTKGTIDKSPNPLEFLTKFAGNQSINIIEYLKKIAAFKNIQHGTSLESAHLVIYHDGSGHVKDDHDVEIIEFDTTEEMFEQIKNEDRFITKIKPRDKCRKCGKEEIYDSCSDCCGGFCEECYKLPHPKEECETYNQMFIDELGSNPE